MNLQVHVGWHNWIMDKISSSVTRTRTIQALMTITFQEVMPEIVK